MPTLTSHFVLQGLQSPAVMACHLAAVALAGLLIFQLSRYERRLISRSLGLTLLSLRFGVLAVILLTLMQPVLSWTLDKKRVGRILIGIDVSDSMSTIDRHASKSEKFRIARGLEMIGTTGQEKRLERWQQSFETDQEPEWLDPDETDDEARRTALTQARRELVFSIFNEVEKLPRVEIARRLIQQTNPSLLEQLDRVAEVELFAFAGKSEQVDRAQLAKVVAHPPVSLLKETTDLALGLGAGTSGENVMGVILFTDGRDHSDQNLTEIAGNLRAAETPVYPVLMGSSYRPKDLSITLLECPQSVYKGDHPLLKVTLGTVGFAGKKIDVELVSQDNPEATPLKRSVELRGTSAEVDFDLKADEIGRKNFLVRIPVQEGETREDNNQRSFSFRVIDDRAKVFLIDGEARWEFRYLNDALSRDERVDLKTVLFDQPYLGRLPEPFFSRTLKLPNDPADAATSPFADWDLVVVGDVSPGQLTDAVWQVLLNYVSEGGTLVLSAGYRDMPFAHRSAALEQLIPVSKSTMTKMSAPEQETTPRERGLPVKLTADGELQPMLQFSADLSENVAIWKGLPGQAWAILGEAKPGATVWATTRPPAGRASELSVDRKNGVIVHQFVGTGQVVWLGFDGTWRWRYRVGDRYHHRFWAQLARWAASKVATATDNVRFGTEKSELELGQDVQLRASWTPTFLQQHPKLKARAEFFRPGDNNEKPFATIDMKPLAGQPLVYEGRALSLPTGEYRVLLKTDEAKLGDKPVETSVYIHDRPSEELSDLSNNRELLLKIAETSGGRLFLPDEVRNLPDMFRKIEDPLPQNFEATLWDRWPWLVILFSLLMTEWVLRKLNGLP